MNDIFILPLTNSNKVCLIDFEDHIRVMKYNWYIDSLDRIQTTIKNDTYQLSRFILEHNQLFFIDHKNRLKLDNRKQNLREASRSENSINRSKPKGNYFSKYKGVSFHKRDKKWTAQIGRKRRLKHLGYFNSEVEAALAYNKAAIELYDDYACLNIIEGGDKKDGRESTESTRTTNPPSNPV